MIYNDVLEGKQIILRSISLSDCNDKYVGWLNDKDVNSFLESRLSKQTINSVKDFVKNVIESDHSYMFAIIHKESNDYIGNIKIGPIESNYRNSFIGYLIGEKKYWGNGLATEAVFLATKFCFDFLKLHKVRAGVIAQNIGSIKLLEKLNFIKEARLRENVIINDSYDDVFYYGILENEFKRYISL